MSELVAAERSRRTRRSYGWWLALLLCMPVAALALDVCPGADPVDSWNQGTLNDTARVLAGLRAPLESELAQVVDASALELVIRLRREPLSGRVDVAIAALTNLGYEVRIIDTFTGRVATATNAPGNFRSFEITDLFPVP